MEVKVISTVFCMVLLLFESYAIDTGNDSNYSPTEEEFLDYNESGNGYDIYLPTEPGAAYNIRLNKFNYDDKPGPDCVLGNALNYMPWLFPNGSLTIRNDSIALDLSNLKLGDSGLVSIVKKLDDLTVFKDIRYLSLAFNHLTLLPISTLEKFINLEYLSLMQNPLKELTPHLAVYPKFPKLPLLIALDMRFCQLRAFPPDFFHEVHQLQYLFLGNNEFGKLPAPPFSKLNKLVHLDLSQMDSSERSKELKADKKIGAMDLDAKAFIALSSLTARLEYVSYCFTDLPTLLDRLFMDSIKVLDLSGNVGGTQSMSRNTFSLLKKKLEVLYFMESDIQRLDWMEELHALKVLNIRNNLVESLEFAPFNGLTNLEVLDVSHNLIQSWKYRIFSNKSKLKLVNLRNNSLVQTTDAMLKDFDGLEYLAIGGNIFQCSCNYGYLLRSVFGNSSDPLLKDDDSFGSNSSSLLKFYDFNEVDYHCTNHTTEEKQNVLDLPACSREDESDYLDNNDDDMTSLENVIEEFTAIYIIASCFLIFVMVLGIAVYWNWFYIKYFCVLFKNSAILSFFSDDTMYLDKTTLVEVEAPYQYDVFVSYSDNDRSWVLDYMLPTLEQEDLISICLHERDFEVGYGILENIISCMDRSRCLMLIVSESFLLSRWCQFEMHLAQHRLLETRRDELILVLLEDLPKRKCPKTLSYLMKTKTYIKWPNERTHEQELFWKRLRKALLSSKR
ncbi:toll-like receptor 13 isoform X2 [Topomyia yanbarensis]|uniref:toll-like receptor 13 isoform X2 n=1 Tax=Topomyia yanbarensis TaxID=2498891 RepID=UPI00273C862E|nr:toll-like receptor 13 isoform X2 [Topomyia yanbarensis]